MSLSYWVAGVITLVLMVYLVFALLQPERFE
jgi:K+-transporting ATPase KdpF subunit